MPRGVYPTLDNSGPIDPKILEWFKAVDTDHSGHITANELQSALINGPGQNFKLKLCETMISLFDKDNSNTIDIEEFQHLFNYINQWLDVFRSFDRDYSGTIDELEFAEALGKMGYRFSQNFTKLLFNKYKEECENAAMNALNVDGFIEACIELQRVTLLFKNKDVTKSGFATFYFEEFLESLLNYFK